ncbi:MAG TPA: DUF58 domain-containing protein [Desulfosporosinus sp.]|nr:DUF58 domain-containing protein [Desulfosporosinus sp.]
MKPIPSLFSLGLVRWGLLGIFILLLYARLLLPTLVLLFLFLTVEGMRFWSQSALRKLTSSIHVQPTRLFAGEASVLTLSLQNRGFMPILLSWELSCPAEVTSTAFTASGSAVLKRHSTVMFCYPIETLKRGVYLVPPIAAVSLDGLNLFPTHTLLGQETTLLVYPKLLPLPELSLKPSGPVGLYNDKRPILPDPIRVAGLREYSPEMPARLIHWKASAQRDRLLARIIEPSADFRLGLAVASEDFGLEESRSFETSLSLAATLICQADEEHIPFALIINARRYGLSGPTFLPMSLGSEHVASALENLARVSFEPLGSLNGLLHNPVNHLPWGTSLFVLGAGCEFTLPPGIRNPVFYDVRPLTLQQ